MDLVVSHPVVGAELVVLEGPLVLGEDRLGDQQIEDLLLPELEDLGGCALGTEEAADLDVRIDGDSPGLWLGANSLDRLVC